MVNIFRGVGLTAEVVDKRSNEKGTTEGILTRFKKGETQILCATKGKRFINFVLMQPQESS
jgi:hypothetical protein